MHEFKFKQQYTLEERTQKAARILAKYNDRVPVICERDPHSESIPIMERDKILVPQELSVAQFIKVIRKRVEMGEQQSMFLFISDQLPINTNLMSEIYQNHKDPDGFLYVSYSAENSFG